MKRQEHAKSDSRTRKPKPRSKYPTIYADCRDRYCLLLTDEQILDFAQMHRITKKDIPQDCFDSLPRDIFIDSIVLRVLGTKYHWPTWGDEFEYMKWFYQTFFTRAQEQGIKVTSFAKQCFLGEKGKCQWREG